MREVFHIHEVWQQLLCMCTLVVIVLIIAGVKESKYIRKEKQKCVHVIESNFKN